LRLREEGVRILLCATLVVFLAVFACYLWFIDILSSQREFGAFLAADLVAFAMLVYIATKPDLDGVKKSWVLIGCLILIVFLSLGIL